MIWATISLHIANGVAFQQPVSVSPFIEDTEDIGFCEFEGLSHYFIYGEALLKLSETIMPDGSPKVNLTPIPRDDPETKQAVMMTNGLRYGTNPDFRGPMVRDISIGRNGVFDNPTRLIYPFEATLTSVHHPLHSKEYRLVTISQDENGVSHAMLLKRREEGADRIQLLGRDHIFSTTVASDHLFYVTAFGMDLMVLHSVNLKTQAHRIVSIRPYNVNFGTACYFDDYIMPFVHSFIVASADERYVHFLAANRVWTYEVRS